MDGMNSSRLNINIEHSLLYHYYPTDPSSDIPIRGDKAWDKTVGRQRSNITHPYLLVLVGYPPPPSPCPSPTYPSAPPNPLPCGSADSPLVPRLLPTYLVLGFCLGDMVEGRHEILPTVTLPVPTHCSRQDYHHACSMWALCLTLFLLLPNTCLGRWCVSVDGDGGCVIMV